MCVCVRGWVSLFRNAHVHIALIICANRSTAGNMFHSTNRLACLLTLLSRLFPRSFLSALAVGLHNFAEIVTTRVCRWRLTSQTSHAKHTLFNLPFTRSLLGRSAMTCCSFQSMSARGSESGIKVRHGTPFCSWPLISSECKQKGQEGVQL